MAVRWAAPEVLKGERCTRACDVWSFGVVLYELATNGAVPYAGLSSAAVVEAVRHGRRLEPVLGMPMALAILMDLCTRFNRSERPSFAQLALELSKQAEIAGTAEQLRSKLQLVDGMDVSEKTSRSFKDMAVSESLQRRAEATANKVSATHSRTSSRTSSSVNVPVSQSQNVSRVASDDDLAAKHESGSSTAGDDGVALATPYSSALHTPMTGAAPTSTSGAEALHPSTVAPVGKMSASKDEGNWIRNSNEDSNTSSGHDRVDQFILRRTGLGDAVSEV